MYSLVASNGSLCKQSKKKLMLTQNVMIVFMLQVKVLSPLMINANDFKKHLLFRHLTGSFVPPLTSPLLDQLLL